MRRFDDNIIDGFVMGTGTSVSRLGDTLRKLQSGIISNYVIGVDIRSRADDGLSYFWLGFFFPSNNFSIVFSKRVSRVASRLASVIQRAYSFLLV